MNYWVSGSDTTKNNNLEIITYLCVRERLFMKVSLILKGVHLSMHKQLSTFIFAKCTTAIN